MSSEIRYLATQVRITNVVVFFFFHCVDSQISLLVETQLL